MADGHRRTAGGAGVSQKAHPASRPLQRQQHLATLRQQSILPDFTRFQIRGRLQLGMAGDKIAADAAIRGL